MAAYDIEITDADVVEETGDDLLTGDEAADAVRDRDHQIAVNTAQTLIRQRRELADDLELALNAARRHREILRDYALPDPYRTPITELLRKYRMDDYIDYAPRRRPKPAKPELEEPQPKELENPCKCGRTPNEAWHARHCPLRKEYR